jgi:hypothetical protein
MIVRVVFVCVCVGVGGLQLLIAELNTNHSPFLRTTWRLPWECTRTAKVIDLR